MAVALDLLRQLSMRQTFEAHGTGPWTSVYKSWRNARDNGAFFSAFSPKPYRTRVLADSSWDLRIGSGMPGFTQWFHPKRTKYLRFGNSDGIEPIVLHQEHHGMRPEMLPQISEEFRLYHNLWMSPNGTRLFKIDDDGSEYEAVRIAKDHVEIRTNLLRQFQAGRQFDLVLFIDSVQHADEIPGLDLASLTEDLATPTSRLSLGVGDGFLKEGEILSRLNGKKVIPAPPKAKAGIWPYDKKKETYPEFIIGEDANGEPIRHSCEESRTANYFGRNPDAPHYLTPVFFRREVLQRYYEQPEKFTVSDGYLRCGSLWGVQIDNDHPQHVAVFLGDLGRDLPESERLYWLSFNVAPSGEMSDTMIRRSFLAQFKDANAPDLKFKSLYDRFNRRWLAKLGWELFKSPEEADEHVLQRLRVPLNDSQPEFEDQVLGLTKLLVDALNEKAVLAQLPSRVEAEKGLAKLRRWLTQENYPFVDRDIEFLKRLQRLRSKLAAHRKGSDYAKVLQDEAVDEDPKREIILMLWSACEMIESLARHAAVDLDS